MMHRKLSAFPTLILALAGMTFGVMVDLPGYPLQSAVAQFDDFEDTTDEEPAALGPDRFVALLRGKKTTVRSFNSNGKRTGTFTDNASSSTVYLPGRWNGSATIAMLSFKTSQIQIRIRGEGGATLSRGSIPIPLRQVQSVVSGDFDNSGLSDLLVVRRSGEALLVRDPMSGTTNVRQLTLPSAQSFAPAVTDAGTVGIAAFDDGRDLITIVNLDGQTVGVIDLQGRAKGSLLPVSLGPTSPGFAIIGSRDVKMFDATGAALGSAPRSSATQIISGDFSAAGSASRDLAIIGNNGDVVVLFSRLQLERSVSIDLTQVNAKGCNIARINRLTDLIERAAQRNNIDAVLRLSTEKARISMSPKCISYLLGQTGNGSSLNRAKIADFRVSVRGGEGLFCDDFKEPKDGNGGFLAKVADKDGKLVVLFPGGEEYVAAELLNTRTFKRRDTLYDANLGNPDPRNGISRRHFRSKSLTPRAVGSAILRGERIDGKSICYRLNFNGTGRID
jgi:hypothetical protein